MSNEKRLLEEIKIRPSNVVIFSNGCNLIPYKLIDGTWGWVVSSFEDDTFYDGDYVNVNNYHDNCEGLVTLNPQEDETKI
jgi:hypothetical protein